jgi:hypothetical protein
MASQGGVAMQRRHCAACGASFRPCPQVPQQRFCSQADCQRERRRRWKRGKCRTDADYRDNQARAARLEGAPSGVLARVPPFTSPVPRAQSAAATGTQRPSRCTRGLRRDCKEERVRDIGAWVFRHLQAHADRAGADCKEERVDGENHRAIKGVTPEGVIAKRVLDRNGAPARLSWRAC